MECENHPTVSGNKWWKLKYNIEEVVRSGLPMLTFGGAYSNHIYAVAAAANAFGLRSIGIIRGEPVRNHVLSFAEGNGMRLEFISREMYRKKHEAFFLQQLREKYGNFFLLPEGGTNEPAVRGCREFGEMLEGEITFDTLCLSVGTGGTIAGIVSALSKTKTVIGFASLKGGEFLKDDVAGWLRGDTCEWRIETAYHFGGYGKVTKQLRNLIEHARLQHRIILDPVYTSKALFGVLDLAHNGLFERGSTVLFLHTGGLQVPA